VVVEEQNCQFGRVLEKLTQKNNEFTEKMINKLK
jgi:hypothetical protein